MDREHPFRNLKVKIINGIPVCQTPMNRCVKECLGCHSIPVYGLLCILASQRSSHIVQEALVWGSYVNPTEEENAAADTSFALALIDNGLDL